MDAPAGKVTCLFIMAERLCYTTECEDIAAAIIIAAVARRRRVRKQRKRKATLPCILKREAYGAFHSLAHELSSEINNEQRQFLRMTADTCNDLLHLVAPLIKKADTSYKDSIPAEERLAVTLRYLASGGPYSDLLKQFKIPVSTTSYVIPETCDAIYRALKKKYLKFPRTVEDWQYIQDEFLDKWGFPRCIGVLDGRHVRIQCPQKSGLLYQNYLCFHSVVLLALVDADYRFLYYETGAPGGYGDAAIWNQSFLKASLDGDRLSTPVPEKLPGSGTVIPSIIVGESAFPVSSRVVTAYSHEVLSEEQQVFNYHLSKVKQVAENTFNILALRFGVYHSPMRIDPPRIKSILLATIALHNFLRDCKDQRYCDAGDDGKLSSFQETDSSEWQQNAKASFTGLQAAVNDGHQQTAYGEKIREALKDYFNKAGVSLQQSCRV